MPVLENPRHELFAQGIAKGQSGREAYKAAGYEVTTDDSADAAASRLLSDVKVVVRVQEIQSRAAKRAEISAEKVLLELAKIGFADITNAVEWGEALAVKDADGNEQIRQGVAMKPSGELPADVSAAISEVKQTRDGIAIKFHDKRAALVDIGKHLGMFKERVEHTGADGTPLVEPTDPEDIARRVAFILAQGAASASNPKD